MGAEITPATLVHLRERATESAHLVSIAPGVLLALLDRYEAAQLKPQSLPRRSVVERWNDEDQG